jgi:hypothetical protein
MNSKIFSRVVRNTLAVIIPVTLMVSVFTLSKFRFTAEASGGVTNPLLWVKADAGVTATAGQVTSWTNQATTAMTTEASKPASAGVTLNSNTFNFNPSISFSGAADEKLAGQFATAPTGASTLFVVAKDANSVNGSAFYSNSTGAAGVLPGGGFTYADTDTTISSVCATNGFYPGDYRLNTPYIAGAQYATASGSATGITTSVDGYIGQFPACPGSFNAADGNLEIGGRTWGGLPNRVITGDIAEVIHFDRVLTGVEKNKVDSYLAAKYGITLQQVAPQNYTASNGSTVMWDATTNASYNQNITVIGRDDTSPLNQKQSRSVNTEAMVTVGRGGLNTSNASNTNTFSSDNSFFSFGDDAGTLGWVTAGAPANRQLVGRSYKAQSTNYTQSVVLSVPDDTSTVTPKLPTEVGGAVYLVVDTDGDGDYTTGAPAQYPMTANGTNWVSPAVTIPTGAVFTFATQTPVVTPTTGPGGVTANLAEWKRADNGVTTSGSTVTAWADQASNTYSVSSLGSDPVLNPNGGNFNPSVDFTSANGNKLGYSTVTSVMDGTANFTVFTTASKNGASRSGILSSSLANDAFAYGIWNAPTLMGSNVGSLFYVSPTNTVTDNKVRTHSVSRSGNTFQHYINNTTDGPSDTNTISFATGTANRQLGNENRPGSGTPTDDFHNGKISEVIVYSTDLSTTDRQKVDSYLATKYGQTLNADANGLGITQAAPTNYLASDSSVYWSATTNAGYAYNITAIGRDDNTALNQKQSFNDNAYSLVTVGRGGISTTNAGNTNTFSNDKSYFAFGANASAILWSQSGAPANREVLGMRFKAQSTNYTQTTVVSVPDNSSARSFKLPAENSTVYMLIDTDGDGDFTTGSPTESAMTQNGTEWVSPAVTIPNGAVFGFATQVSGGGAVGSVPSTPNMAASSDSGSSNTDNITNDTTPTFDGTCTTGETVSIYVNGTVIAPTQVCASGAYSITPTTALPSGNHAITASASNVNGASAQSAALNITIDATNPTPAVVTAPSTATTLTPTISGTGTNGDTVTLRNSSNTIIGGCQNVVVTAGAWSCTPTSGLVNGANSVTPTTADTAGNTATGTAFNIAITTGGGPSAPAAPTTAPNMLAATDTGASNSDNITNDTTPTFDGTCTNGETIKVYVDGVAILPTQVCAGGVYSITPTTALTSGNHAVTLTTANATGESPQSPALTITIDSTAPLAPTGSTTTPTNDTTPTFTGTGENGATVEVKNGATTICTAVVSGGSWSCTPATAMTDGAYTLAVTQIDVAGNTSPAGSVAVTIDTTAPVAPVMSTPTTGTTTTSDMPTFTGTGENGATVTVRNEFGTVVCIAVVAAGAWSCTPTQGQGEGTHVYKASQTDASGNASPASTGNTITLDINSDGSSTADENAGPNSGDANGDGILDSRQQNVSAKRNPNLNNAYVTLEVDAASSCPDIRNYEFKAESQLSSQDSLFEYPLGLYGLQLRCNAPGGSANVTILLDKQYDTSKWVYRKYNSVTNQYRDVSSAITYGTRTVGGVTVTTIRFNAVDGGAMDEDGIANGQITDPNGPAISSVLPTPIANAAGGLANTGSNLLAYSLLPLLAFGTVVFVSKKRKN